jgi:hypothetical protein
MNRTGKCATTTPLRSCVEAKLNLTTRKISRLAWRVRKYAMSVERFCDRWLVRPYGGATAYHPNSGSWANRTCNLAYCPR